MHLYTLEVYTKDGWKPVKSGLSATLAAFAAALAMLEQPGALWRAIRDDGEVYHA